MYLCKTDKGREELTSRSRALSQRERAALLMADGTRTCAELRVLLQFEDGLVEALIAARYLQAGPHPANGTPAKESRVNVASVPAPVSAPKPASRVPSVRPPAAVAAPAPATLPLPTAAPAVARNTDNFDGKRSLATTRMFLFDIGERMFAQRHRERATLFRDRLREARDRDSMLSVARDMIAAVEEIAGHERADSLSERIAMLLPPEG